MFGKVNIKILVYSWFSNSYFGTLLFTKLLIDDNTFLEASEV